MTNTLQVIVIGGGLAGLLNAILLARAGIRVLLIEQKHYPFHRVCGEYISHEVTPYLKSLGLYPRHMAPAQINTLKISTHQGRLSTLSLPLGGFGISRHQLDLFWYHQALDSGVDFKLESKVVSVTYSQKRFQVVLYDGTELSSEIVKGAFGKRSLLDKYLQRSFMEQRSPYVGVKYHVKYPWEPHEIALHNFEKGYCGVSQVEQGKLNVCYLTHRDNLKKSGDIATMEKNVLGQNPHLNRLFQEAEFLFDQPLVINEISFKPKQAVEKHLLMSGDAAGLITPLCGNGMAMAIRSAHLLSTSILTYFKNNNYSREQLEKEYTRAWKANFSYRLAIGRKLQDAFQTKAAMDMLVTLARWPLMGRLIVKQTHGSAFYP